ncbi:MAG: hypothetical protein IJY21_04665 [Clostridia bacterium]|nr:hypothetical protein [Clostridia bacterium]
MKKLLTIIVTLVLTLGACFGLSSCSWFVSKETGWFEDFTLEKAGLADLPKPDFTYTDHTGCRIEGWIEPEEFERYVQEVFTYLTDKYDYVGAVGAQYSSFFGGAGTYKYVECEKVLSSYKRDGRAIEYEFVFFRGTPKEGDETTDGIALWHSENVQDGVCYFTIELKNYGGLKDKYRYTAEEVYDSYTNYGSDNWRADVEYPYAVVVRTQEELAQYQDEPWYSSSYESWGFSGYFMVAVVLSTSNDAERYDLTSVKKQDDKYVVALEKRAGADEGAAVMGEWYNVFTLDDYVQIYSPDDIIINIV